MTPKLIYKGRVKDGKIELPRKRFKNEVVQAYDGKSIIVTVERKKKTRSPEQNRFYWGVVVNILCHFFKKWNPDLIVNPGLVHEWCKDRFLPMVTDWEDYKIKTPEGEKDLTMTTTVLTTTQFMDYLALIQQWASEFGIVIPNPDEWEFESVERINVDKAA